MVPLNIELICMFDTKDFLYKSYCNVVDTSLIYKEHKQVDTFIYSAFCNFVWMKGNARSVTRPDGSQGKCKYGAQ